MNETVNVPSGWIQTTIKEIARTQTGGTPSRRSPEFFEGSIPWVKSGELRDGVVYDTQEKITQEAIENSSAKLFPKGTVCIALYGATIGKVGILGLEAATNQAICGIMLPEGMVDRGFMFHILKWKRRSLIEQGQGGAQPNISNAIVRDTPLPLPPINEQRRIVAKIEELFSELDAGVAALERVQKALGRYRASVLKAAVEGRLTAEWRAKHSDVEPASELLQRVLQERRRQWEADQLQRFEKAEKKPPTNWQSK